MSKWVWIYIIVVLIGAGLIIALDSYCPDANYDKFLDPFVLFATLIVIVLYTAKTAGLARATKEQANASARLVSIQAAEYLERKEPLISFLVGLDATRTKRTGEGFPMSSNEIKSLNRKELQTPVLMSNASHVDAAVRVALNCRIDGDYYEVGGDDYSGRTWWNLQAGHSISTPGFSVADAIFQKTGKTIEKLREDAKQASKQTTSVTLDIVLTFVPVFPKRIFKDKFETPTFEYYLEKAPLRYDLNLIEDRWVYVVQMTPVS